MWAAQVAHTYSMPKSTKKKKKTKVLRRKKNRRKEKFGGNHAILSQETREEICSGE